MDDEMDTLTAQIEPFLVDAKEAGRLVGVSRPQFLALDKSGRIGPQSINLGNGCRNQCRRWKIAELRQWAAWSCPSRREWLERKETLQEAGNDVD